MVQFVPPVQTEKVLDEVSQETYDKLIDLLEELEIEEGFVQELADNIPWIPDFTRENPFPESFAEVLPEFLQMRNS
jgi:putative pyruvate formate lyase activating enzyme